MSVSRRFWSLVCAILLATMLCSALAIWFTSTPFLEANQSKTIQDQAQKDARAFDSELAQYEQLLHFVAAQENVVSVVIGYVENSDVVNDYFETLPKPETLVAVTLLDALKTEIATTSLHGDHRLSLSSPNHVNIFDMALNSETAHEAAIVKLIREGDEAHILMAVPVFNRGFSEGVLLAEFHVDFDKVFGANNVTRKTYVTSSDPDRLSQQEQMGHWLEPVAGGQLTLVAIPDTEATAQVGRHLLLNVMFAISATLLVSFSVFAWLGRATIVQPHKKLEQQKEALAELAAVAENANDAILVTDLGQKILWGNPSFEMLSGYSIDEVRGRTPGSFLQGPGTDQNARKELGHAVRARKAAKVEVLNYSKTGEPYWIAISVTPLAREDGSVYGFMAISHDVTLERQQREKLAAANRRTEHLARHDALTGLPNRRVLNEELERRQNSKTPHATLLRIDLDHFKNVNDTMGHDAGDHVLQIIAEILKENSRSTDIPARVGGDEFIILLSPGSTSEHAMKLGHRILSKINQPRSFEGKPLRVGASFGVASTLDGLIPLDQLISSADAALYKGKDSGRNQVIHYGQKLHDAVCFNRELSVLMQSALENREFEPYFQPQIDAKTGEICGFEALARWHSPKLGVVQPDVFLPVAAQLACIEEIDECIFQKGMEIAKDMQKRHLTFPKVSFNVTAPRIHNLAQDLNLKDLPANGPKVSFEILESVFLEDQTEMFKDALVRLRAKGYQIEIDDFGSGHASIVGLMQIRPNHLKIDRRLVMPILESQKCMNLLRSIIDMGKTIDVGIVAEGVETLEHAITLQQLGCDVLQGYHFAKPLHHPDLITYVKNFKPQMPDRRERRSKSA